MCVRLRHSGCFAVMLTCPHLNQAVSLNIGFPFDLLQLSANTVVFYVRHLPFELFVYLFVLDLFLHPLWTSTNSPE